MPEEVKKAIETLICYCANNIDCKSCPLRERCDRDFYNYPCEWNDPR